MEIVQWHNRVLRVTTSNDDFYRKPLQEITLFRFATPRCEVDPHEGAFSLKLVLHGTERYFFRQRTVAVTPDAVLLIHAGETYASLIEEPAESLALFFRAEEVAAAAEAVLRDAADLLNNPVSGNQVPEAAQIAYPQSVATQRERARLVQALDLEDAPAAEEATLRLLLAVLSQAYETAPPQALPHIRKRSTRDELIKRALHARDFVEDHRGQPCTLDDLAATANLSKYHFLKVFTDVFGETPVAYARRCRLEEAREALERGEDLARVARGAGYRNLRSFKRAYARHFGHQP